MFQNIFKKDPLEIKFNENTQKFTMITGQGVFNNKSINAQIDYDKKTLTFYGDIVIRENYIIVDQNRIERKVSLVRSKQKLKIDNDNEVPVTIVEYIDQPKNV